ncbi:MAG TPA: GNAT family N-acetyltransferase [Steroidobacteraceae bacterium]|nr:GNAT family N-acetyltransferase [Steroidobacteraceae bacterium]
MTGVPIDGAGFVIILPAGVSNERRSSAMSNRIERSALFESSQWKAVAFDESDAPVLQQFFEHNPEYFLLCNGRPPVEDEALQELRSTPPAEMTYTTQWFLAILDEAGEIIAIAAVLSDFIAEHAWLISLFIVASSLHGTGQAKQMYDRLEEWMQTNGAAWLRLGVVRGNVKAERFWENMGYMQVRERHDVPSGIQVNTLRVMVKPLAGGSLTKYLTKVERDRPD